MKPNPVIKNIFNAIKGIVTLGQNSIKLNLGICSCMKVNCIMLVIILPIFVVVVVFMRKYENTNMCQSEKGWILIAILGFQLKI